MPNLLDWLKALRIMRRLMVQDGTPAVDRAELAKAGDTHSRKVVADWVETMMEQRRWNADAYAAEMFTRGLMASAADGIIGSMMSDGKVHIVEAVES